MSLVDLAPQEALKTFFGFDEFKGEQEHAIQSVLDGRDTFVIMPTGGGKSMCYQLPALMMDGVALVISPLIALMKNQVDAIRGHHEDRRVAHFLNSSLSKSAPRCSSPVASRICSKRHLQSSPLCFTKMLPSFTIRTKQGPIHRSRPKSGDQRPFLSRSKRRYTRTTSPS